MGEGGLGGPWVDDLWGACERGLWKFCIGREYSFEEWEIFL
jgi:hypothetical protein